MTTEKTLKECFHAALAAICRELPHDVVYTYRFQMGTAEKAGILDRKKELLDEIGFVWEARDHKWHLQHEKLAEFKRKYGHCKVPRGCEQDKTFGCWVDTQRTFHAEKNMRLDRKELLDEIGFVWESKSQNLDKLWNLQHDKLVELKQKNGHCVVPQVYELDKSLGYWVRAQRKYHTQNK